MYVNNLAIFLMKKKRHYRHLNRHVDSTFVIGYSTFTHAANVTLPWWHSIIWTHRPSMYCMFTTPSTMGNISIYNTEYSTIQYNAIQI